MKKIISLVLALATLLCAIPLTAVGISAGDGGICGENLTWSCGGGECVLTISGTGAMYDYSYMDPAPWAYFDVEKVIIEEGVTTIGDCALAEQDDLYSVTLPSTLDVIGEAAFGGCSSLTNVALPQGLTEIGSSAFANCHSLKHIYFPASFLSLGSAAFAGTESLESITVDPNNTFYDSRNNCNALMWTDMDELLLGCKNTVIPEDTMSIGYSAFKGCLPLENVTLPTSVRYIYDEAFAFCPNLKNVYYKGSDLDWKLVYVGDYGNDGLYSALHCASVADKKTGWHKVALGWCYIDKNGEIVKQSWMSDSKGWCYLNYSGIMVTDDIVEDTKGLCLVDESGYWVTKPGWHKVWTSSKYPAWAYVQKDGYLLSNSWMKDSKGWCHLNYYGYMDTDCVVSDSKGCCLVDENGYWVTKQGWHLCQDGYEWVYVQKDGYLKTDGWMKDSKGWCFLDDMGYMVTDDVVKDSKGWCLVDKSGYWVTKEGWHKVYENYSAPCWVYVQKGGYLKTGGWMSDSSGKWCYLGANGIMLTNTVVEDSHGLCAIDDEGYWVTAEGWLSLSEFYSDYESFVYVGANGYLYRNCRVWDTFLGGYCYVGFDGYRVCDDSVFIDGAWYYADATGLIATEKGLYQSPYLTYIEEKDDWVHLVYYVKEDGTLLTNGIREEPNFSSSDYVSEPGVIYVFFNAFSMDETGKGVFIESYFIGMSPEEYNARGYGVG